MMSASSVDDELVAVTSIHRHGDRMPFSSYPADPHKNSPIWTASPGELTNVGKKRMYELGQWLRERYNGFLSSSYKKDEIYVVSSDKDRCISSAAATLAGLFPPKPDDIWNPDLLWQPIPVHTIPIQFDDIFTTSHHILKYKKFPSKYTTFNDEDVKNICEYLTIHTGKKISHVFEAMIIADILFIEELNNLSLPEWTKEVYPEKLKKIFNEFFSLHTETQENIKLSVGRLLYEIIQQFDFFAHNSDVKTNVAKMKMYSAHDVNVHCILDVFKVPHSLDIPYGAALMLELRRKDTGELYVQLIYKTDKIEKLQIESNKLEYKYAEFKNMLSRYALNAEEYSALILSLKSTHNYDDLMKVLLAKYHE